MAGQVNASTEETPFRQTESFRLIVHNDLLLYSQSSTKDVSGANARVVHNNGWRLIRQSFAPLKPPGCQSWQSPSSSTRRSGGWTVRCTNACRVLTNSYELQNSPVRHVGAMAAHNTFYITLSNRTDREYLLHHNGCAWCMMKQEIEPSTYTTFDVSFFSNSNRF